MSDEAPVKKTVRKRLLAVREVVPRLGGASVFDAGESSNSGCVEEVPASGPNRDEKKSRRRLTAYKRAQQAYEHIQEERRQRVAQRQVEREQREASRVEYESIKEKMNKALKRTNRRGQPKLDAQMAVLLEKIEHRAKRDRPAEKREVPSTK